MNVGTPLSACVAVKRLPLKKVGACFEHFDFLPKPNHDERYIVKFVWNFADGRFYHLTLELVSGVVSLPLG